MKGFMKVVSLITCVCFLTGTSQVLAQVFMDSEMRTCKYKVNIQPGEQKVMPSGRVCMYDTYGRKVLREFDRQQVRVSGEKVRQGVQVRNSRTYDIRPQIHVPPPPQPKVEVTGEGLKWWESMLLGMGCAALVSLAISIPLLAHYGYFDSGYHGPDKIRIQASGLTF